MSDRYDPNECGVCWASHMCHPRGFGELYLYQLDLLRYANGDFCDVCGVVAPVEHNYGVLDHAMKAHPEIWAKEYAADYSTYLGDGKWKERE